MFRGFLKSADNIARSAGWISRRIELSTICWLYLVIVVVGHITVVLAVLWIETNYVPAVWLKS